MTPILVLVFGVTTVTAVGTDLWFAAFTKIIGGLAYFRHDSIDWEVFRRLCLGSLPTSVLTSIWIHSADVGQTKQGLLLALLGCVLILTAIAIVFKERMQSWGRRIRSLSPVEFKRAQPGLTVLAGSIMGLLVTLTSVGAGALGAVILVYLYPFRMRPARLVATDIVHAVPLTIVAGTGHLLIGNVNLTLLGTLLLGSAPGVIVGSMLSRKMGEAYLRLAIAAVLTAVGCRLLF